MDIKEKLQALANDMITHDNCMLIENAIRELDNKDKEIRHLKGINWFIKNELDTFKGQTYYCSSCVEKDKQIEEIKQEKQCTLKRTDDDCNVYECSNCKDEWVLIDGTPEENNINYCQNCGAKVKEVIEIEELNEVE